MALHASVGSDVRHRRDDAIQPEGSDSCKAMPFLAAECFGLRNSTPGMRSAMILSCFDLVGQSANLRFLESSRRDSACCGTDLANAGNCLASVV